MSKEIELLRQDITNLTKKLTPIEVSKEEFLTIPQTAEFLQVSISRVYKITHRRELPFIKNGKIIRFRKSDLISWLNSNLQAA